MKWRYNSCRLQMSGAPPHAHVIGELHQIPPNHRQSSLHLQSVPIIIWIETTYPTTSVNFRDREIPLRLYIALPPIFLLKKMRTDRGSSRRRSLSSSSPNNYYRFKVETIVAFLVPVHVFFNITLYYKASSPWIQTCKSIFTVKFPRLPWWHHQQQARTSRRRLLDARYWPLLLLQAMLQLRRWPHVAKLLAGSN